MNVIFELLISIAITKVNGNSGLNHHSHSFSLLINVNKPTIVPILTFMSRINFMLKYAENSFITSGSASENESKQYAKIRN